MLDKKTENWEEAENEQEETSRRISPKTWGRIRLAAASIGYLILVFVVIYGLTDGVYHGFPGFVPYMIIVIFLAMAFVRMYQCILGRIPEKKKEKSSLFGRRNEEETDDTEEVDDVEEDA